MTYEEIARIAIARKLEDRGPGFCPLVEAVTPHGFAAVGGFPLTPEVDANDLPVVRSFFAAACESWKDQAAGLPPIIEQESSAA